MDEIAKLYLRYEGKIYRIKIFSKTISIERQPGDMNIIYDRFDPDDVLAVYDREHDFWDYAILGRLIDQYIAEVDFEIDSSSEETASKIAYIETEEKEVLQARAASAELPTISDVQAFNPKADGYFIVLYDGGGEYVLYFRDYNGTIVNQVGEPIERHIKTYQGAPTPAAARADAIKWLKANASWL
jgi:hypothetical protein